MTTWYPEYVKFIEEVRKEPFQWGNNDCASGWATRLVKIVSGKTIELPSYVSERGAIRAMRKSGFSNLKDATEFYLGSKPLHPSRGCVGDLALIKTDGPFGYAYGIVNGERVFFRGEKNIGTLGLLECDCIFKL